MFETMFIGVGNEFRNDDGVGIFIVRELQKRSFPNATFLGLSGEGTELMDAWKNADEVYVFDAVSSGETPGTIFEFDAKGEKIPSNFFNYSTHDFSLAEAVELSRVLNQLPPALRIFGIEGKDFSEGRMLSPEVKASADIILQNVFINGILRDKLKKRNLPLTVHKMQRSSIWHPQKPKRDPNLSFCPNFARDAVVVLKLVPKIASSSALRLMKRVASSRF